MKRKGWARGRAQRARGCGQSSVQAINRGGWFFLKASIGKPIISHFATTPPLLQHQHPLPSSIFRVCSSLGIQDWL
ncbi:hypothetical protein HanRHA438_Chr12g0565961 [Helianthus annuus]|nr:hypothetical protein HanRHA438_Chr12g0565961 [Helianthus annuus]